MILRHFVVLMTHCFSFTLFCVLSCQPCAAEAPETLILKGGYIERAIPARGAVLRSDSPVDYSFQVGKLSLNKTPSEGRMLALNVYVAIFNVKTSEVVYTGEFGIAARVTDEGNSIEQHGGGRVPKNLIAGKYELLVMSYGRLDDNKPKLLDVHAARFRVTDARSAP
jgi:hypothetical protein